MRRTSLLMAAALLLGAVVWYRRWVRRFDDQSAPEEPVLDQGGDLKTGEPATNTTGEPEVVRRFDEQGL